LDAWLADTFIGLNDEAAAHDRRLLALREGLYVVY
jgi:hypothetical protein